MTRLIGKEIQKRNNISPNNQFNTTMKKVLVCLACMLLVCAGAVAQNRQGGRNNRQGNGRQFQPMAVIDTAVINHIGLSDEVLAQVYALQEKQAAVAEEQMKGMMPERGKRMTEEARNEMQEKTTKMKAAFRLELRNLIGDESYITYLEKQLDSRGMFGGRQMQMGGMNGQRGNWGGQGGQGGFGGGQGGFGGGDFPGGGF